MGSLRSMSSAHTLRYQALAQEEDDQLLAQSVELVPSHQSQESRLSDRNNEAGADVDGDDIEEHTSALLAPRTYKPTSNPGISSVLRLLIFFLINSLAFGLIAVPRINFVVSLVCLHQKPDADPPVIVGGYNPQCLGEDISSATARLTGQGNLIVGILAAGTSSLLGAMSDKVGRLKIIALNTAGIISAETVIVLIAKLNLDWRWIYVAFAVDGISGSYALTMAMASAYVSDTCPGDERSIQIGRLHGAMFVGIAIGPLLSSAFVSLGGDKAPLLVFYAALSLRACSLLYLRFVPESLRSRPPTAHDQDIESEDQNGNALNSPRWQKPSRTQASELFQKLHPRRWLDRIISNDHLSEPQAKRFRRNIVFLVAIDLIIYAGAMGTMDVLILYPQVIFHWGNVENNTFMAIINAFRAAVSTLGIPLLVRTFRPMELPPSSPLITSSTQAGANSLDKALIRTAVLIDIAGYVGYAMSPSGVIYTLCGTLASFAAVGLASTEAALTKHVLSQRTGELMGGLSLVQAVVRIVVPTLLNYVYSYTVGTSVPEAPFLGIAAVLCIAALLTLAVRANPLHDRASVSAEVGDDGLSSDVPRRESRRGPLRTRSSAAAR